MSRISFPQNALSFKILRLSSDVRSAESLPLEFYVATIDRDHRYLDHAHQYPEYLRSYFHI